MKFTKMHGIGNDFVLVEKKDLPNMPYSTLALNICQRHTGIGADGMVIVLPSDQASIAMRIFNADGSEPEQCGNAVRCVAKYAYEQGLVHSEELTIETKAGLQKVWLDIEGDQVQRVRVDMGKPILEASKIPVQGVGRTVAQPVQVENHHFQFTAVSMGNPHMVIEVEDVETFPFQTVGPLLEKHPLYPQKTNVEFITIQSPNEITMRVWERGVGPTFACGTGACASVVAGVLMEKTDRQVLVHLQGGDLWIDWSQKDDHVYMTGEATRVFTGEYPF